MSDRRVVAVPPTDDGGASTTGEALMDRHDPLARLDAQLDELQALARLLDDAPTVPGMGRLRRLLAAVAELQEQDPARIPDQRAP